MRKIQFIGVIGLLGFYFLVYRKYNPKPVKNTALYHQAIDYIKKDDHIKQKLGSQMLFMNCNGKIYPTKSKVNFDLMVFGMKNKANI